MVLLAVVATPLSAQIRLPKPKLPTPSVPVSAPNVRMPTFDDRVLEMTDARLTALGRGLKAMKDQRAELERGYKKNADDRAAQEGRENAAFARCQRFQPAGDAAAPRQPPAEGRRRGRNQTGKLAVLLRE